ncbi:MAG: SDR family oxidoreductase [Verrucomicrobia bacterium]|nr:SDR family oxidoreductase [Verrucomicrobiota bacterium]
MKIFLTGASGLVGAAFAKTAAQHGHEVTGIVGRHAGAIAGVAHQRSLDLSDVAALAAAVHAATPAAIVNCAAISEPAACDTDPVRSEALNVALPAELAQLAHRVGARLIHISSEQVFDGTDTKAYRLTDAVNPINLYGHQKLASERAVLAAAANSATVRAPLLMGDSPGGKRGLHERLFLGWSEGRPAKLYTDEYRQPCTAQNLADVLLELTARPDLSGIFHWAGTELVSRHELGRRIREHFKLSEARAPIIPVTRAETPEIAKGRQACLALDLAPLAGTLRTKPQSLAEQLATLKVPPALHAWAQGKG